MDVFFESPPHLFGDYDGNVGCVGSGFDIDAALPSTGFLFHVGNVGLDRNDGNQGWGPLRQFVGGSERAQNGVPLTGEFSANIGSFPPEW